LEIMVLGLLNGISFGMVLFLLASGLSLIMGLMGILNLAHGAFYMIGAYIGWTVAVKLGLSFWFGVLAGGLFAGLIGLFLERGFLRHLYKQINEQVLLTFGFIYILSNLTQWIWGPIDKAPFAPSLLSGSFGIVGRFFPYARLGIILLGAAVAVGLWWLQEKTRVGAMVRAGMDDRAMTMALGINVPVVYTALFFLGSFLAGCAGVIGAQMFGARISMGIEIMLLGLIVLIVGGVGSVQGSLLGSILIGTIDAVGRILAPDFAMFTMYMAMVIILLFRPTGLLGRRDQGVSTKAMESDSWQWKQRSTGVFPYISGLAVLCILPLFFSGYLQSLMTKILIFSIFAMSLDLIFGYAGLISLGHAAYFGAGAYTVAVLILHYDINSLWISLPLGVLVSSAFAAIFGLMAIRVSGNYFLLVTFALGQLLYSVAFKWRWLSSMGTTGIVGIEQPEIGIEGFTWNHTNFYYFVLVIFVICFFFLYRIVESRFGYVLRGIRESDIRMSSLRYNTWLYKYISFIIAGLFAGVSGVLFAYHNQMVVPNHLAVMTSGLVMFMIIIGGTATIYGPVIGSAIIILLEYYSSILTPQRWPLILGAVFIVSIMFARRGVSVYISTKLYKAISSWKR